MINIRKGCFETNSSSMHSLAIWKNPKPYDDYCSLRCDEDGTFHLFDWESQVEEAQYERYPFQILKYPIDKLRYLVGYYYRDGVWKDEDIKLQLESLVKTHTSGCKDIQWQYEDWDGTKMYASTTWDNDSGEFPLKFLDRKGISLEDFVFSPKYTVQVDGDEFRVFADMFDSGIIDISNIEDISSGLEYWTKDYACLYIEDLSSPQYQSEAASEIEAVGNVWIYEFRDATEEDWKLAADLLSNYRGKKNIKIRSIAHNIWAEKYLPWVKEKTYE